MTKLLELAVEFDVFFASYPDTVCSFDPYCEVQYILYIYTLFSSQAARHCCNERCQQSQCETPKNIETKIGQNDYAIDPSCQSCQFLWNRSKGDRYTGTLKMRHMKMQDWKMWHKNTGLENAGMEKAGTEKYEKPYVKQ